MTAERPKRHYRRREDLRSLLVEEGAQLLADEGIRGGENVTLARVIQRLADRGHARVTTGSVLGPTRLWTSQREFQLEVQASLAASSFGAPPLDSTLEEIDGCLATADLSTGEGRSRCLRELCRLVGQANFNALVAHRPWRVLLAILGTTLSTPPTDDDDVILEALRRSDRADVEEQQAVLYAPLLELLQMRVRPQFEPDGLRLLVVAVTGLAAGLSLHARSHAEEIAGISLPDPDGSESEWHLFALGLDALVHYFLEPVNP